MTTTVATTILEQLGGSKFRAMTGAKNFLADGPSLRFTIHSSPYCRANRCTVTLDASDTYTMTFHAVRGLKAIQIASESGLYAEMLRGAFTRVTGLETSLGSLRA